MKIILDTRILLWNLHKQNQLSKYLIQELEDTN